jgi:hypothetical protein
MVKKPFLKKFFAFPEPLHQLEYFLKFLYKALLRLR